MPLRPPPLLPFAQSEAEGAERPTPTSKGGARPLTMSALTVGVPAGGGAAARRPAAAAAAGAGGPITCVGVQTSDSRESSVSGNRTARIEGLDEER